MTIAPGRRALVALLYDLYLLAGAPAAGSVQRLMEERYAAGGEGATLSRQGVLNTLQGKHWPRWETLESLVRALALRSRTGGVGVEDLVERFRALWAEAVENGSFAISQSSEAELVAMEQAPPAGERALTPPVDPEDVLGRLTPRELEIAALLTEGYSNHEIGRRLHIADGTVATHMSRILQKLNVQNRGAAIALMMRLDGGGPIR
jgi:ATP/maltotriose-dependent transcriptional regulator MalT